MPSPPSPPSSRRPFFLPWTRSRAFTSSSSSSSSSMRSRRPDAVIISRGYGGGSSSIGRPSLDYNNYHHRCPIRSLASHHPEVARRVLSVPDFRSRMRSHRRTMGGMDGNDRRRDDYYGDEYYDDDHDDTMNPVHRGGSLEDYLDWRGWDVRGILRNRARGDVHHRGDDENCDDGDDDDVDVDGHASAAVGLLSHPLTFPLTLGRHFARSGGVVFPNAAAAAADPRGERGRTTVPPHHPPDGGGLRICCVGARAECTLPDDYWREFLIALVTVHHRGGRHRDGYDMHGDEYDRRDDVGKAVVGEGGRRTTSIVVCTIDFVGPDVPRGLMTRTIDLSLTNDIDEIEYEDADGRMGGGNNDDEATVYRLVMNYHPSFLHEVVLGLRNSSSSPGGERTEKTVEEGAGGMTTKVTPMLPWDGYALFNPGLGHPNLRGMWHQTLKFLLRTDKPMLITAHSIIDASRDREVLEETITADDDGSSFCCSELPLVYDDNPYASRMGFVDPFYSPADQMGKGWDSVGTENAHHGVIHPNHSVLFLRRALSTDG